MGALKTKQKSVVLCKNDSGNKLFVWFLKAFWIKVHEQIL